MIKKTETKLFYTINQRLKCRPLDAIMLRITNIGSAFFTLSLVLIMILFGKSATKSAGWQAMAALIFSHGVVQGLKLWLRRDRPFFTLKGVNILGKLPKDASFPSGHSTASFALATSLAMYWPAFTIIGMGTASLVAISRIYLGYHYPSDVIVGTALGILSALSMGWLI